MDEGPAGATGGPSGVPDRAAELPDKLRVHALARLVGSTSKQVMATLAEIGEEVRSVQANVSRATAEQVLARLTGRPVGEIGDGLDAESVVAALAVDDAAASDETAAPPGADVTAAGAPALAPDDDRGHALGEAPSTPPAPAGRSSVGLAPLFNAAPMFQAPSAPSSPQRAAGSGGAQTPSEPESSDADEPAAERKKPSGKKGRRSRTKDAPAAESDTPDVTTTDTSESDDGEQDAGGADDDGDDDAGSRRRRRRGRRGRGRGRGGEGEDGVDSESDDSDGDADDTDEADDEKADAGAEGDGEDDRSDGEGGGSRRRRRRRRRGADGSDDRGDDDPPNTVTKVRQPREKDSGGGDSDDGVQSVRGSTRLEAKRQRRRDGRDAGRRRPPILSESEFLARREAVDRSMVIRQMSDRTEIGVLEDDVLVEHFITGGRSGDASMVGNIYLGRVQNVLPSMEAAFVDIGRGRNAVLYAGEVNWDAAGLNGKARKIEQALSSGDQVLVQVTKDPVGHKGARLTTQISLAGRFLVYVPSGSAAGISRKLPDTERKRLKDMLKEIVPSEAGVIIRTASEGVSHEALERDVRRLQAQWDVVKDKSSKTGKGSPKAPTLLYEEPDMLVKVVRDQFNEDFSRLIISGADAWDTVSDYVSHVAPELGDRMHRHTGPGDVFTEHRIDEQLLKALDRKVWLPSGGTLVIDRTEAMTVVDVNTGKFTGSGGNLEETVTRNNLEAAEEVVRQLRLRDIGGIIVVDFIDMVLEANRDLVLRRLTECLARDRTRHQVAEVTSLGLVQLTRKRVGGGLLEHFSTPCEHCRGRGVIVSADGMAGAEHQHDGGHGGSNGTNGNGSGNGGPNGGDGGGRRSRGRGRRGGSDRGRGVEVDTSSAVAGVALIEAASRSATVHDGQHVADTAEPAVADTAAFETPAVEPAVAEPDVADTAAAGTTDAAVVETGSAAVDAAAAPEPSTEPSVPPQLVDEPVAAGTVPARVPEPDRRATRGDTSANGSSPVAAEQDSAPTGEVPAPSAGREPGARRRRVSRSAGSPSASAEPVVITTAPVPEPETSPTAATPVVEQPEPVAVSVRPRRTRRSASRPAGPPVDEPSETGGAGEPAPSGVATGGETGTDPV